MDSNEGKRKRMHFENLSVEEQWEGNTYRLQLHGDLLITNAKQVQEKIDHALQQGTSSMTLDLTQTNYIDSFGIGVVVKAKSEIDKRNGRFRVIVNPKIFSLFEKCHLDDYINLETQDGSPTSEK